VAVQQDTEPAVTPRRPEFARWPVPGLAAAAWPALWPGLRDLG